MKKMLLMAMTVSGLCLFTAERAAAISITLGEQDFSNGQVIDLTTFQAASVGEPAPFDQFYGSDPSPGPDFNQTFTFNFAPGTVTSATLTFGIFDGDGDATQVPGDQLTSFTLDGIDLTAEMAPIIDMSAHVTVVVGTLVLPASALAALADGVASFTLVLDGPSLEGQLPFNGAGLDFATLTLNEGSGVPDAGSSLLLLTLGILVTAGVRRKSIG